MSWFPDWVETYCVATGADQRTAAALRADERIVLETWCATPEELGEVTARLIARCQVPVWAAEHIKALGRGLIALREERRSAHAAVNRDRHATDCDCPACIPGGSARWQELWAKWKHQVANFGDRPPRGIR